MNRELRPCVIYCAIVAALASLVESILGLTLYGFTPMPVSGVVYTLVFLLLYAAVGALVGVVLWVVRSVLGFSRIATAVGTVLVFSAVWFADFYPTWKTQYEGIETTKRALTILGGITGLCLAAGIALAIVFAVLRSRPGSKIVAGAAVTTLALALTAGLALPATDGYAEEGAGDDSPPAVDAAAPAAGIPVPDAVVVISFDAMCADHMSFYGYPRATSPALDKIFDQSLVFTDAYATKSKTAPSLASLITGFHLPRHGLLRHGWRLPDHSPTVARILNPEFATASFLSNPIFKETVRTNPFTYSKVFPCDHHGVVLKDAWDWLVQQDGKKVYLWAHLAEPHTHYTPPDEDFERFRNDAMWDIGARIPYTTRLAAQSTELPKGTDRSDDAAVREAVNIVSTKYDAFIRYVSDGVAEFVDRVKARRPNTMFIITSDHGESMVDHDYFFYHGRYAYESGVHIPMAIHYPEAGLVGKSSYPVSLIDVMPTICARVGCDAPAGFDGIDLLTLGDRGRRTLYFSGGSNPVYSSWSMQERPWKLILTPKRNFFLIDAIIERRARIMALLSDTVSTDNPYRFRVFRIELYNIDDDPGELRDLSAANPERVREMEAQLLDWLDREYAAADKSLLKGDYRKISNETMDALKALGYIQE